MTDETTASERARRNKPAVVEVFNTVAAGYDNEAMRFFPFCADRMIALLALRPGEKVLDIGTGTGQAALAAAHLVGPSGRVTGIDLAEAMLDRAREHFDKWQLRNVDLHVMDAQSLEFRAAYFDAAVCSFGLFFLPDMAAALRDWHRVLKPGARMAFSSFGAGAFQPMFDLFRERLADYDPETAEALPTKATVHLQSEDNCRALAGAAGFVSVELHREQLGYHLDSVTRWWDVIWNSGFRAALGRLDPLALAKFKQSHLNDVARLAGEQGIWMDVEVLITVAHKPV